jgi:GNAT superfamily N-acetyltransferase
MKIHMSATFNRVSRLVVLPDYQGIGLGKKLLNFMADYYTRKTGLPFKIITSNPQILRSHLTDWVITSRGHGQKVDSRHLAHPYTSDAGERLTVTLMYKPKIRLTVNSSEKQNLGDLRT